MNQDLAGHGVILFDGVCNLCNSAVQFIIRRDSKFYFYYAAIQSEAGQRVLAQYHFPLNEINSIILLQNGKRYTKSTAALLIARQLTGLWPLIYIFIVIPKPLRDPIYNYIARNRYKWFGQKVECMLPTPEMKRRFLE
jgi:predicted DCC family thiol-disulfide oxidoreductase YuxK